MALDLDVIISSKEVLEPLDGLLCALEVGVHDLLRHLARQTGRATNQAFVIFFEQAVVDTRIIVEAVRVGDGAQFAEAMVTCLVLGQ